MSRRSGARVLGPYEERAGWRVVEIDAAGNRSPIVFPTEAKALRYIELMRAELNKEEHTTASALAAYKQHLTDKQNKPESIRTTVWAIERFFPDAAPLALLTPKRCQSLYDRLRTVKAKTGRRKETDKPISVDSHRNSLNQTRTFLGWCVSRGWLRENPLDDVKGIGKRRPRGKSLGTSGNELHVREARAWYGKALELAHAGDEGATAALVALLLGMRASEITTRRVGDLDDESAAGDLLWIPCSKTPSGRRTLEVPDVLRELLVSRAKDKAPDRFLFEIEAGKRHHKDWLRRSVHRICDAASVPRVTAHAMRGLLATLTAERGLAGHLIAATLGHADEAITMTAYARPGSASAGARRKGWQVLNGGVQVAK